jgi:protein N-terminal amidase
MAISGQEDQKMKIACLQFAPEVGRVQENIQRADTILRNTQIPTDLTWLVLPELAFSGYNFHSLEEIKPFLEPTTSGISTQWAIQVAHHYACHVTIGYPEITPATPTHPSHQYNSTVTVSPTGQILANYRKSFLYYTDETWSSEGPGDNTHILSNAASPDQPFYSGPLGDLGEVTLGICMDINPHGADPQVAYLVYQHGVAMPPDGRGTAERARPAGYYDRCVLGREVPADCG